ncbi:unnamed protein product [Ranitomeya imitator]|uniref:ZFYVE26-like TPR repeats domain-containing protein n=1 Tax=Ranitomeya imitator TaxID=111125 RepID=A0ABN9LAK4_9NEOB|nr:unnamed protein product [Ranitomeya imitator]
MRPITSRDVIEGPLRAHSSERKQGGCSGDDQGASEDPGIHYRTPSDICVPLTCIGIGYRYRRYPIFFGYRPIPILSNIGRRRRSVFRVLCSDVQAEGDAHTNRVIAPSDMSVTAENAEDGAAPTVERGTEKTAGTLNLSEVLRLSKAAEVQWWLTLTEAENKVERNEFYYEQAPSASLCSAILSLHSKSDECGYQLIERCCLLSKGLTNPEMDSRLLLDIMKNLLFSAKMIFVKAARSHDLALCDREKFSRCIKAPFDLNQKNIGSKLLEDIVQHLESAAKPILLVTQAAVAGGAQVQDQYIQEAMFASLLQKDDEYFATLKELEVTLKARCLWYEMMPEGKIQNNAYYQECLYYLHTYGTHLGIIQFYMRHDLMRDALLHLLNKDAFFPIDLYWRRIATHRVRRALDLSEFGGLSSGKNVDCNVFCLCRENVSRRILLHTSLARMEAYGRRIRRDTSHINTVELQMEITKFLQRCESLQSAQVYDKQPPTLFGHSAMMLDVASRVILGGKNVEEGFGIAFRVIQDFQLDAFKVYSKVCKQLVQQENYPEILQLVKCVSESGIAAEKDCDKILLRCVEEMADVPSDELEKLIQGMKSDETKIKAFLACRMMRSAYLTAVKQEHEKAIQLVQEVWQAAHNLNDSVVQGICSKWLVEHPPVSKPAQRHTSRK